MVLPNCEKWFKNMKSSLSKDSVHLREIAIDLGVSIEFLIEKLKNIFD